MTSPTSHTRVAVVTGAANGIGLQATLTAIHRGLDFYYLCYDNEGYMNTGVQRSAATPPAAPWTRMVIPGTTSPRVKSIR